jgi:integrase
VVPSGNNVKQALDERDKTKLLRAKTKSAGEAQALAAFTFSYYCNGMNFSDMAYLTRANIKGDLLTFIRRKTETTKKRGEAIQVVIHPEVKKILKGLQSKESDFLFGIITKADGAKVRLDKIRQWIKTTNKFLGYISERLDIKRVTTYTARHTMATSLLRNNVNIVDIRDALGHSSVATTEKYLKGLNIEGKRALSRLL